MRQDWIAEWEEAGIPYTFRFTSLTEEIIAHTQFQLECMQRGIPVPPTFQIKPLGEPYTIKERGTNEARASKSDEY